MEDSDWMAECLKRVRNRGDRGRRFGKESLWFERPLGLGRVRASNMRTLRGSLMLTSHSLKQRIPS